MEEDPVFFDTLTCILDHIVDICLLNRFLFSVTIPSKRENSLFACWTQTSENQSSLFKFRLGEIRPDRGNSTETVPPNEYCGRGARSLSEISKSNFGLRSSGAQELRMAANRTCGYRKLTVRALTRVATKTKTCT